MNKPKRRTSSGNKRIIEKQLAVADSQQRKSRVIIVEKRQRILPSFRRPANMLEKWGGHQHRVSELAGNFAEWLHQKKVFGSELSSGKDIETIRIGGSMHDTGKNLNRVRNHINNTKPLRKKQLKQVVRNHTLKGFRSLAATLPKDFHPETRKKILDITKYHHEHFDGTGPHRLKGEEIPFSARLVSVCDAFDAITDPARKYKKPLTKKQALGEIINDSGIRYDPKLVELFSEFVRESFTQK